jgi:hypothetical protein
MPAMFSFGFVEIAFIAGSFLVLALIAVLVAYLIRRSQT